MRRFYKMAAMYFTAGAALIHLQHLGEEVPVPGDVARMDVHLDRLTFGQKKKEEGDVVSIW